MSSPRNHTHLRQGFGGQAKNTKAAKPSRRGVELLGEAESLLVHAQRLLDHGRWGDAEFQVKRANLRLAKADRLFSATSAKSVVKNFGGRR